MSVGKGGRLHSFQVFRFFLFLALISLFGFSGAYAAELNWVSLDGRSPVSETAVKTSAQQPDGVTLNFTLPGYYTKKVSVRGQEFTSIELPSSGHLQEVGKASLPTYGRLIAVPAGAKVRAELISAEYDVVDAGQVYPCQPDWKRCGGERPPFAFDADAYASSELFPNELFEVSQPMIMRGLTMVRINTHPFLYVPSEGRLLVYRSMNIRLTYDRKVGREAALTRKMSAPFAEIFRDEVLDSTRYMPLRSAASDAGLLLIITHASFYGQMQSYAEIRHRAALPTVVTSLADIGNGSKEAIRDYIADAYNNWAGRPP